jgi:hypothetical protein
VKDIVYVTGEGELDSTPVPIIEDNTHWIIQNVQFPDNVKSEIESVRGVLQAVSDGSFKDAFGTAAWMIHVSDRCVLRGHCVTPGNPSDQSAYRSELTGIYGIVCTIWYLYNKYGMSGHITVGCDGLSALRQAQKTVDFVDPNIAQYDMIMAIRTVISQSSWQWDWIHVKGHQDDAKSQEELDQWSLWNIQMDAEAKQFWKTAKHQYIDPLLCGEPWRTTLDGRKMTSNLRERLREACCTPPAMAYWDRKGRFGSFSSNDIDWDVVGAAMKQSKPHRQRWVSKTISGFCATGQMMKRRKERDTDACPRCGAPENVQHIWKCTHYTNDLWESSMKNVKDWLLANQTHPEIARVIVDSLTHWHLDDGVGTTHIPWLQAIIDKQKACGWHNFLRDYFSRIGEWL